MADRNWVITPDDMSKGDLLPVGWYPAEIIDYDDGEAGEKAKNPGSATAKWTFKIIDGPNKDGILTRLFSETAWGFAKTFFAVLKFPKDEKGNYKVSSAMFRQTIGAKMEIYNARRKDDNGNEYNDVKDFRPMR